ncbi:permease prefix domain 1-containing protein [Winogradskya humida]|uniref:Uncharacterized protein n=1 Tax=Winogradskya humida TaxID=113566 RepID=A0ABQ3ZL46_9ACTN|nr:permease prefix domain 1-containing protein [Actinoplanes humidus]GIE19288.1 hypothetical protein Ahu01nite_023900 [Actinoplanes humidus]
MTATGPVERYLDEMFDLLSGTGADGRRLLIEAEEHLAEAVAEGRARGLDDEAAERQAVDRFGAANTIARRVPGSSGTVRLSLRRLTIGVWALTGTALAWYGLSGALTWLLSWPWTRLLIATDRFGGHPMCSPPWIPPGEVDCVRLYQQNDFPTSYLPHLFIGGIGVVLVIALLILRRSTALGAPLWTPKRSVVGLVFAVPFGLAGVALVLEGIQGITLDVQYYTLGDLVGGLLAIAVSAVALRRAFRPGAPRLAARRPVTA